MNPEQGRDPIEQEQESKLEDTDIEGEAIEASLLGPPEVGLPLNTCWLDGIVEEMQ